MGQKVNPYGFRIGINKTWRSRWFVDPREYADTLHEDLALRRAMEASPEARGAEIGNIEILRQPQRVTMIVSPARPGVIIGTKGANIERLRAQLQRLTTKTLQIKIKEIKRPEADAQLIAFNIARQLRNRSAYRRVLKMAANGAMRARAQGIKIKIGGRLGGAEIARTQGIREGRVPLHTLRAEIDYGFTEAKTTFGVIGVKVWIFRGELFKQGQKEDAGRVVGNQPSRFGGGRSQREDATSPEANEI